MQESHPLKYLAPSWPALVMGTGGLGNILWKWHSKLPALQYPAILLAAVATVFYGRLYDSKGFIKSILPVTGMLLAGYAILYFTHAHAALQAFIGSLIAMTGYLAGMSIFGAMIRDNIPEGRAGQFQGVRIIGQVFVPGLIGPAVSAWLLRNAEVIVNNDGTESFLPGKVIWSASAAVIVILIAVLMLTMKERKEN